MKIVLLAVGLLLTAGAAAWADHQIDLGMPTHMPNHPVACMDWDEDMKIWTPSVCRPKVTLECPECPIRRIEAEDPCLAKMENAMRAIEPFVEKPDDPNMVYIDDLVVHHKSRQEELRDMIERLDKREVAWAQWESVKNQCWSIRIAE